MNENERRNEILGRILGPEGPELTCERCFEELDRYVELEIAGADAEAEIAGMQAHLEGCQACAEDYESLRDLVSERQSSS